MSFEYYFMERNGLWNEHRQEVVDKGRKNASPIARLIYACEIGDGINQHASEDLKAISAKLTAQAEAIAEAKAALEQINPVNIGGSEWKMVKIAYAALRKLEE